MSGMPLTMLLPPAPDRRWTLARQMGVTGAIAKLAPELTGLAPPSDAGVLAQAVRRYAEAGLPIVGLEGDQFDMTRIKFGLDGRDADIAQYRAMLRNLGDAGIRLLCLNFMAGLGWYRTETARAARGDAHVTAFRRAEAEAEGETVFGQVGPERIWDAFAYFIERVAPVAEAAGVRLALHPDDPPVSPLRGIGRILTSVEALAEAVAVANSPNVGVTFCQGSFATMGADVCAAARRFGREQIFFVHTRDIRGTADDFVETFPDEGASDMPAIFRCYAELHLDCPIRPDHAPAMEGDPRHDGLVAGPNVGYEANGMIHSVGYMRGLMQAVGIAADAGSTVALEKSTPATEAHSFRFAPIQERVRMPGPKLEDLPMRTAMATFWPPTEDRLRFMKQLGIDDTILWATTFPTPEALSFKELVRVRTLCEACGLRLVALESVLTHFYDRIVLGGEGRDAQIEAYKRIIQSAGRAGVSIVGYNWMISGVWRSNYANPIRGGARATAFDLELMRNAPLAADREYSEEEFWDHYEYFIRRVIPAAEAEGVRLALHPNDPPVERLGGLPCLMRSRANIERALAIQPSDAHGLTFCLGNWGAMGADLVAAIRHFGPLGKLLYVHFQATRGTVPRFTESFVDDADYDPFALIQALDEVGFKGVMIPGHVPQIELDGEWRTELSASKTPYHHPMGGVAARAFTIGYLKALITAVGAARADRR